MLNMLRRFYARLSNSGVLPRTFAALVLGACVLTPRTPFAQQQPLHLNPVVAKLAEGKTVYGIQTNDWSLAHARETARSLIAAMTSCSSTWSTIRSTSRGFTSTSWE